MFYRYHSDQRDPSESAADCPRRSRRSILYLDGVRFPQTGRTVRHLEKQLQAEGRLQVRIEWSVDGCSRVPSCGQGTEEPSGTRAPLIIIGPRSISILLENLVSVSTKRCKLNLITCFDATAYICVECYTTWGF